MSRRTDAVSQIEDSAEAGAEGSTGVRNEPRGQASASGTRILRALYTRLFPKPFDMVSTLLYLGALGLFFYDRWSGNYGWRLGWAESVVVAAAIVALLALERWDCWFYNGSPPDRISSVIFISRIVLIEVVAQLDNFSFSPFLYLVIPFSGFLYRGMRLCYLLAALVLVVYVAKLTWYAPGWYTSQDIAREFLIFLVGLLFMLTMAKVVGNEQRSRARSEMLLEQLEESHRQLSAYSQEVEELATAKERNRLARDIHDSLGHYLTVINVQLEKALAFKEARPDEASRAIGDAKRLAREALQDVRRSVGALRFSPERKAFSLRDALEELVQHTGSSELSIQLSVSGSEEGFSAQGLMALYRVAQEALTNIQKHARAKHALLTIEFGPDEATLCVSDDGSGFDPAELGHSRPDPDSGYGLLGLDERLELLGGSFRIESSLGEGTSLYVSVPRDGRPPVLARTNGYDKDGGGEHGR